MSISDKEKIKDMLVEMACTAIRMHLQVKTISSEKEIKEIAQDYAQIAIDRLFSNGEISKMHAGGYIFYQLQEV